MQANADENLGDSAKRLAADSWPPERELKTVMVRLDRRMQSHMEGDALLNLSYAGRMPFVCVNSMLEVIRESLRTVCCLRQQQRNRLIHVAIELFQNVSRHGYDGPHPGEEHQPLGFGLFRVETEAIKVVTANLCTKEASQRVQEQLARLNGLTRDQVRALHKVQLTSGEISALGGAGLGFMDVVLRGKRPIGVSSESIDDRIELIEISCVMPVEVEREEDSKCADVMD